MSFRLVAQALKIRVPEAAAAWFDGALIAVGSAGTADDTLLTCWSGAGRRLGREPLIFVAAESRALTEQGAVFVPHGWGADEVGRALLLIAALDSSPGPAHLAAVEEVFRTGDNRERQALLRVLSYLPDPRRFVPVAAEAVRNNVLPVLAAITCANPFPAAFMPEAAFNQMIMKALFNGVPLVEVIGLARRHNPELVRMVASYAAERRAAGRSVPADVDLILKGETHASV